MKKPLKYKLANIVFFEDNIVDIEYTKCILKNNKIIFNMHVCRDGMEALDFLYKRGAFIKAVKPDIIFLDLNLPKLDGKKILKIVKNDQNLNSISIVILSGSSFEKDIEESYQLGAQFYVGKPFKISNFLKIVEVLDNVNLKIVEDYIYLKKKILGNVG